ncbi:hypothetical protein L1785_06150 [Antribacter sp. KLBMP9083]|uniref:ACT domain-containing protein n=1 Tax=Antribacter soli TaxID=2910976 RepID=A0AA41U604_9MICO|nr:ACT domain-containing protein [Antribacter soli]MCF4120553.1 hypothetical protein [Antribacter soli]
MSARLQDLEVELEDRPGALADLGQALGRAGVSLEGGGVVTHRGAAVAHYLVDDGAGALDALRSAGIGPARTRDIVMARLDQETPGQLGALARLLGDADVNLLVQYSDHAGNLVLVVKDADRQRCEAVAHSWNETRSP